LEVVVEEEKEEAAAIFSLSDRFVGAEKLIVN